MHRCKRIIGFSFLISGNLTYIFNYGLMSVPKVGVIFIEFLMEGYKIGSQRPFIADNGGGMRVL